MEKLSNVKLLTVTELSNSLKELIEDTFQVIKVSGELSQVKNHSSGHIYFTLKDERNTMHGICWKSNVSRLQFCLEDGLEVVVTGKITTYSPQSRYQIILQDVQYAGEGYLLKILEERRKKLLLQGLFDSKYKKELPKYPQKIGIITSESGAVINDIIHRIKDRFPIEVILYPAKVQGCSAVKEVINGIKYFNYSQKTNTGVELLVVARGGGSLEDLMPFNDESLVREIFKSNIPVVSAVGHETDITLCDFVSDLRAPTPSAAIDLVIPNRNDILFKINERFEILNKILQNFLKNKNFELLKLKSEIPDFNYKVSLFLKNLDYSYVRLSKALGKILSNNKLELLSSASDLNIKKPDNLVYSFTEKLKSLNLFLNKNFEILLTKKKENFKQRKNELSLLSYKNTLKRGYSVVRYKNKIISNKNSVPDNSILELQFYNGKFFTKKLSD